MKIIFIYQKKCIKINKLLKSKSKYKIIVISKIIKYIIKLFCHLFYLSLNLNIRFNYQILKYYFNNFFYKKFLEIVFKI